MYATGVPVSADEAFNRALQQQHHRQSSWGSNTSAASATAPEPAAAAVGPVTDGRTDGVSTTRLLATIHSGIPSTDDDGPLFAEMHKLAAEEEEQAQQRQEPGQNQTALGPLQSSAAEQRLQSQEVNLNQVSLS